MSLDEPEIKRWGKSVGTSSIKDHPDHGKNVFTVKSYLEKLINKPHPKNPNVLVHSELKQGVQLSLSGDPDSPNKILMIMVFPPLEFPMGRSGRPILTHQEHKTFLNEVSGTIDSANELSDKIRSRILLEGYDDSTFWYFHSKEKETQNV